MKFLNSLFQFLLKNRIDEEQFTELVYKNRNREYGSYILRKLYHKNLFLGALTANLIIITAGVFFFIKTYLDHQSDLRNLHKLALFEYSQNILTQLPDDFLNAPPQQISGSDDPNTHIEVVDSLLKEDFSRKKTDISSPDTNSKSDTAGAGNSNFNMPGPAGKIYRFVESMPSFPGGDKMFVEFVRNTLKYPQAELQNGFQGKVMVSFIVREDGSITDLKVLNGVTPSFDKEAIRVMRAMPKWIPGKQHGIPVPVILKVPIRFALK